MELQERWRGSADRRGPPPSDVRDFVCGTLRGARKHNNTDRRRHRATKNPSCQGPGRSRRVSSSSNASSSNAATTSSFSSRSVEHVA